MNEADLIHCLRVVSMPAVGRTEENALWFLKHIEDLAPELHRRGWIAYSRELGGRPAPFASGRLRILTVTELGKKQLDAEVVP